MAWMLSIYACTSASTRTHSYVCADTHLCPHGCQLCLRKRDCVHVDAYCIRTDESILLPGNFIMDATVCPHHGRPLNGHRPIVRPSVRYRLHDNLILCPSLVDPPAPASFPCASRDCSISRLLNSAFHWLQNRSCNWPPWAFLCYRDGSPPRAISLPRHLGIADLSCSMSTS